MELLNVETNNFIGLKRSDRLFHDSGELMVEKSIFLYFIQGRSLSYKTFFIWILISIYQGGIIMFGGILLFDEEFIHVVTITFTSLILTELLMVALTIRTWHWLMVAAEVFSLAVYIATLAVFKDYFGEWTK